MAYFEVCGTGAGLSPVGYVAEVSCVSGPLKAVAGAHVDNKVSNDPRE